MAGNIEKRARAKIRQLHDEAGLTQAELALVLGMDVTTLERHLGKGRISSSRARQYAAIVNVSVSSGAVHLVVARPQKSPRGKPQLTGQQLEAEKRRAAEILDGIRSGRS